MSSENLIKLLRSIAAEVFIDPGVRVSSSLLYAAADKIEELETQISNLDWELGERQDD